MSSAPGVLAALVALGTASLDADVQVIYGQPGPHTKPRFFAVGWDEQSPGVIEAFDVGDLRMSDDTDSFTVMSTLVSWTGEPTAAETTVADVYAMFATLSVALSADHTLSGACDQAQFTAANLFPALTTKGPVARLALSLTVVTY